MDNFTISALPFKAEFAIIGHMSKESPLIYQAEAKRVKGPTKEALESARERGAIDPETISSLPPEELADKWRWWRIWTVTLLSLYRGEWNGQKAADYLLEARNVIKTYYCNQDAWERAKTLKTDAEGHEYQMAAEVCRDEGKYFLCAASLTGNNVFVKEAIVSFEEAISLAEKGTSAWAVAIMEKEISQKQGGQPINWEIFRKAYETIVKLAPQAGGWDRMAAVSWWYTKEALWAGKKKELQLGLENLKRASHELGINWIKKYPLQEIVSSLFTVTRRVTARGISSDQFKI